MDQTEASRVLGVATDASWTEVRAAYRTQIGLHHPDRAGDPAVAARVIEAFGVFERYRQSEISDPPAPPPPPATGPWREAPPEFWDRVPPIERLDPETLALWAPADETFRWLLDAVHDVGEITYLDRSMPIVEVLCRFVGEPATSLLITLQGRAHHTEVLCSTESIEARTGPPTVMVVDLVEAALRRRAPRPPN